MFNQCSYLLDQQIRVAEKFFIEKGDYKFGSSKADLRMRQEAQADQWLKEFIDKMKNE
jgi:hypothetical protein